MEIVPPKKVFQTPPGSARTRVEQAGYDIPDFLYPGRSANGGMVSFFKGHPFPRKGFIYSEGVIANNKAKRVTLALFKPFTDLRKGVIGFLESYLYNYNRLIESIFADYDRIPLLHYEYYCEFSKAVWDFTTDFLTDLGISFEVAHKTGHILATIFEYDDAYKIPLMDVLSETTKKELLGNPRKAILRLLDIYTKRSHHINNEGTGAGNRIVSMGKSISYLLWIPKVKKAFQKALENVRFEWFQFDESDEYWALSRLDYEVRGLPFEVRQEKMLKIMESYAKKLNPDKKIKRVEKEDGSIDIIAC